MVFSRFFKKCSTSPAEAAPVDSPIDKQIRPLFYSGKDFAKTDPLGEAAERPTLGTAEQDTTISTQLDLIAQEGRRGVSVKETQTLIADEADPLPESIFIDNSELLQQIEEATLAADNALTDALTEQEPALPQEGHVTESGDIWQPGLSLWQQDLVEGTVGSKDAASKSEGLARANAAHQTNDPPGYVVPLAPLKADQTKSVYWRERNSDASGKQEINLTLKDYAIGLALLNREQRKKLKEAASQGLCQDYLQRELVVIDNRATLLHESYEEELQCLRTVLHYLEAMPEKKDDESLALALGRLKNGEIRKAEEYLVEKSRQTPVLADDAYYCGQLAERRVDLKRALEMYRMALSEKPDEPRYFLSAGITARVLYRHDEALSWLTRYGQLIEPKRQSEPLLWAQAQRELAYTYVLRGQYKEAGPLYKLSMTTLAKQLGQNNPEMAASWYQIGEFQESLGEYEKAMILYKKALYILEKHYGPFHPQLINILDRLGTLCMELEMENEAVYFYKRKAFIQKKTLRADHPQLALSLDHLAEAYHLQGQYAKAKACYQQSLLINKSVYGAEHPSVAVVYQELAKLSGKQNEPEEAANYQLQAGAIFRKQFAASQKNGSNQEVLALDTM